MTMMNVIIGIKKQNNDIKSEYYKNVSTFLRIVRQGYRKDQQSINKDESYSMNFKENKIKINSIFLSIE